LWKGITWNVRRSTVAVSKKEKKEGKLEYIADLMCDPVQPVDFFMLQEVAAGHNSEPPPDLERVFSLQGRAPPTFLSNGAPEADKHNCYSRSGVAIIVDSSWIVSKVKRHPSGRGIALVADNGRVEVAVVSLYLPSGLDNEVANSQRNTLATQLLEFAAVAVKDHTYFVIGGDLNETRRGTLDRRMGGVKPDRRLPGCSSNTSVIEAFLRGVGSRCADLFRSLRPEEQNFTHYQDSSTSASRIDYLFVPGGVAPYSEQCPNPLWECEVMEKTQHSDHCPVVGRCFVELDGTAAAARGVREQWRPDHPRLDRATPAQLAEIAERCNTETARLIEEWQTTASVDADQLEKMTRALLSVLKTEAVGVLESGARRNNIGARPSMSPLNLARAVKGALCILRHSVKEVRLGGGKLGAPSVIVRGHKVAVGTVRELLGSCPAGLWNLAAWEQFIARELPKAEIALNVAWSESHTRDRDSGRQRMQRLFEEDAQAFIHTYVKGEGARQGPIDSAINPETGERTFDPEVYLGVVRRLVAKPMSTKVKLFREVADSDADAPPLQREDPRPRSTDARVERKQARWWNKMYSRKAKGIPARTFAGLTRPAPTAEVGRALAGASSGKSPGPDGCGIDLLKLVAGGPPGATDRPCLSALAIIVNHCIRLGHVPPILKEGWITLVPKQKTDGSFSKEADEMRPITVLAEVAKLLSRVLAQRLIEVLTKNRHLLHESQRGFIADGCVEQCVGALLDCIEDWKQNPAGREMFVVSYDQRKAYDSVQAYTIRATLERFNMPELFIRVVLSGITDAHSRVRTFHGLTDRFLLRSSVRQGDPLSPLIYTLITDAMHAGLEDNPLFPETAREGGYTFKSHAARLGRRCSVPVRVNSAGYADDAALVATDPVRLAEMHAWMREFFGAHCFAFNVKKTKLLCSNPEIAPPLYSVDGKQVVEPLPAGTDVRYLGLGINLRLNWKATHDSMERAVLGLAERVRRHAMDIPMATMATKQVLVPRLRSGLLFAKVPDSRLEKWDDILRRAVFQGSNARTSAGLAKEALYLASGLPRLSDHAWALRAEEVMVTLNAEYPSSATAWARMGRVPGGVGYDVPPSKCRVVRHVTGVPGAAVFETEAADRAPKPGELLARCRRLREEEGEEWGRRWRPDEIPTLFRTEEKQNPKVGDRRMFYTDGSTGPVRGLPSGSSVIRADGEGQVVGIHAFAVRTSGNNYLAELVAFAAALIQTPLDTDSVTWSDALSVKHAVERGRDRSDDGSLLHSFHLTQRQRILSAARPVMNIVRAVIAVREGASDISHVRAHTGGADVHSRLNEVADAEANRARIEAAETGELPYLLAGEEKVWMSVNGVPVIGSYRRQVLRAAAGKSLARLASMSSQGLLAGHGGRFTSYCAAVAKTRNPHLIRFATLAIAEWLPCEKVCWNKARESDNLGRGPTCKLCGDPVESVRHTLCDCQAAGLPEVRTRAMSRARDLVEGRILVPASGTNEADGEGLEWRGRGHLIPAWFDPSGEATIRVPPGTSQRTIASMRSYDPLAGLLGILPPGLDELLTWEQVGPVHGGLWRRRQLGCIKSLGEEIRRALMWVGVSVWSARCRAMDKWWMAGGAAAVRARANLHAEIGRRAHRKAAKAAARGPVVSRRKPKARPKRQKVGKRTRDALRAAPTSIAANRPRRPPRRCSRDGFFVSFGADADGARDEALERAAGRKLRGCAWY